MFKKQFFPSVLLIGILFINVLRFLYLEQAPYGMIFDEQTSGVTLQCLVEQGVAPLSDQRYPLFGDVGIGNPKPPTYMYPGMLWVKAFGFSPGSLRAFTVFFFTLSILGLLAIGWQLRGWRCGLWIMTVATISPWTWTISRVGQEPSFLLAYLIWGIFLALRAREYWEFILAGALFAAAAYTYPPARIVMPFCILLFSLYGIKYLNWKKLWPVVMAVSFCIVCIPLLYSLVTDTAQLVRWKYVSITKPEYLALVGKTDNFLDLLSIAWGNFWSHFTPDYLFFRGLPDWGVGTWRQGILSWTGLTALLFGIGWLIKVLLLKKKVASPATMMLVGILFACFFIGILPCTITIMDYYNLGNNMRSICAWPFAMIAFGMIMHKITQKWPWTWAPAILMVGLFSAVFLTQYFTMYPKEGALFFRAPSLEMAQKAKSDKDWLEFLFFHREDAFASRYFLMYYHKDDCMQARNIYESMNPVFKKMAENAKQVNP